MVYLKKPEGFSPIFKVVSCIFLCKGHTLILHRLCGKSQGGKWGMPSGKVEKNETLRNAMKREVLEETGLVVPSNDFKLFRKFFVDSSGKQFVYYLYYLDLNKKPEILINPLEHSEYKWVELSMILTEDLVEDHPFCMRYFLDKFGH